MRPPPSGPPPAIEAPPLPYHGRLSGKRIVLAVCGSIAAYKAASVARLLLKEGAEVQAVLTASAERFIGAPTFGGLTGKPALSSMWDPGRGGELHVDLAGASDLLLIVPATADTGIDRPPLLEEVEFIFRDISFTYEANGATC